MVSSVRRVDVELVQNLRAYDQGPLAEEPMIEATTIVSDIVRERPGLAPLFEQLNIDYCCAVHCVSRVRKDQTKSQNTGPMVMEILESSVCSMAL